MPSSNQIEPADRPGFFLSLGAGNFQIPLLEAAKRLGFRCIAVDRDLKAPGMPLADLQIQSDITDSDYIIRQIQENLHAGRLLGVASRSFGDANRSVARIADHFQLPGNPVHSLKKIYHKKNYKIFLKERGIAIPPIYNLTNSEQLKNLSDPILVRPSNGHAKLGLELLKDRASIEKFLSSYSNNEEWLIEQIIPGREYTVMGLVENGRYHTILITDKLTSPIPPLFAEIQHTYPAKIRPEIVDQISLSMQRIVEVSHITQGPIVAEFIKPDAASQFKQALYLVECNPETGGEYLAEQLLPRIYPEADYFADLVRLACGISVDFQDYKPQDLFIALRFFLQKDGVLQDLIPANHNTRTENLFFWKQLKKNGESTSTLRGNLDRLAVFGYQNRDDDPDRGHVDKSFQQAIDQIVKNTFIQYE